MEDEMTFKEWLDNEIPDIEGSERFRLSLTSEEAILWRTWFSERDSEKAGSHEVICSWRIENRIWRGFLSDKEHKKRVAAALAAERARCIALVDLEIQSAENDRSRFASDYIEGWINALERLQFKFKGVE